MPDPLNVIASCFRVPGKVISVEELGDGIVNDTYKATLEESGKRYQFVLQRINEQVFPRPDQVMENIRAVTEYAAEIALQEMPEAGPGWGLPRVILTKQGLDLYHDKNTGYWRAISLVPDAVAFKSVQNAHHAREIGLVLGRFHRVVSGFPMHRLHDTLPGFHVTPSYLKKYDRIIESPSAREKLAGSSGAGSVRDLIKDRRELAGILEDARERGELRLRPIHGDPKVSNIMIDKETGRGVSIVDLDTIKPGLVQYDFGDAVRSVCNPFSEDCEEDDQVHLDLNLFEAFLGGYLSLAGEFLSQEDFRYLYDSIRLIPFELGLRFFTDYLEGNVYFKVNYDGQNLRRSRIQMRFFQSVEEQENAIRSILEKYRQ